MEYRADVFLNELVQFFRQIIVRGKRNHLVRAQKRWIGGLFTFETNAAVPGVGQGICQRDPEPPRRKISETPNLVNRFVAGSASHNRVHEIRWQAAKWSGAIS